MATNKKTKKPAVKANKSTPAKKSKPAAKAKVKAAPKKSAAKPAAEKMKKPMSKGKTVAPKTGQKTGQKSGQKSGQKTGQKTGQKAKAASAPAKANNVAAFSRKKTTPKWSEFFTPLDDRVLVELGAAVERTPGGLFVPDSAAEKPVQGIVVAVGRGHRGKKGRMRPLDVQLGDRVLYGAYTGSKVQLEGQELLLLREAEIIAVFKD